MTPDTMTLERAFMSLKNEAECAAFLRDLLTPQEYKALRERLDIAQLLNKGGVSYREISKITGASVTTVTRVARFLKDEPYQGYRIVLNRLNGGGEIHKE